MQTMGQAVQSRPAETGGITLSTVVAAVLMLSDVELPPQKYGALMIVLSAVPLAITKIVNWRRGQA